MTITENRYNEIDKILAEQASEARDECASKGMHMTLSEAAEDAAKSILRCSYMLPEKECPVCGKRFYPPDGDWAYRRGGRMLCSWRCVCEHDRKENEKYRKRHERAKLISSDHTHLSSKYRRNRAIIKEYRAGHSATDIAERYMMTADHVRRILRALGGKKLREEVRA